MKRGTGAYAPRPCRVGGLLALVATTLVLTSCGEDRLTAVGPTPAPDKDRTSLWEMAPTVAASHAPVGLEAIIDFNSIGVTGATSPFGFVQGHTQWGFTLVDPVNSTSFAFFLWRDDLPLFSGSAALANASAGVSRHTQHDNLPFDVISIDLGGFNGPTPPPKVTFTGVKVNGGVVTVKVNSLKGFFEGSAFKLEKFSLGSEFTNLVSLEWVSSPTAQFDNIVVVPQVAPPEPPPGPAPTPGAGDATLEIRRASLDLKDRRGEHAPDHRFSVTANFVLSEDGDGMDVPNEDVEVTWGAFSVTIPAGSFKPRGKKGKNFKYYDSTLKIELHRNGRLRIDAKRLDLSAIDSTAPIEVGVRVGNDSGRATITFNWRGKFKR